MFEEIRGILSRALPEKAGVFTEFKTTLNTQILPHIKEVIEYENGELFVKFLLCRLYDIMEGAKKIQLIKDFINNNDLTVLAAKRIAQLLDNWRQSAMIWQTGIDTATIVNKLLIILQGIDIRNIMLKLLEQKFTKCDDLPHTYNELFINLPKNCLSSDTHIKNLNI
jgi:hypothetical protein